MSTVCWIRYISQLTFHGIGFMLDMEVEASLMRDIDIDMRFVGIHSVFSFSFDNLL